MLSSFRIPTNSYNHSTDLTPMIEQNEDHRNAYQTLVAVNYLPEQLVFVDETAPPPSVSMAGHRVAPGHDGMTVLFMANDK